MDLTQRLIDTLRESPSLSVVLGHDAHVDLPDWYIAGGCIPTVVWNLQSGNLPDKYLNDIDLVYYDATDITAEAEAAAGAELTKRLPGIMVKLDVKNQARVHLWYKDKNGQSIAPYPSTEAAIDMWLSVTAVGVRRSRESFDVYAPYGLADLFSMEVRPNRQIISEQHYRGKVDQWLVQWPELRARDYTDPGDSLNQAKHGVC